jgi:hypothetical protein
MGKIIKLEEVKVGPEVLNPIWREMQQKNSVIGIY